MAFRRTTNLPCKISKKISLRLHPDIYHILKQEAEKRTLESGRWITIGDIIRESLDSFTICMQVPPSQKNNDACHDLKKDYHQLLMALA